MKRLVKTTALTLLLISPHLWAADADLDVRAEVSGDFLSITPQQTLDFGAFTAPGSEVTITVNTEGNRTPSVAPPNIFMLGAGSEGIVNISGIADQPVTLSTNAPVDLENGAATIALNNITFRAAGESSDSPNVTLPNADPGEFTSDIDVAIGGQITVPANPAPGTYTGTLVVTVDYQL